MTTATETDLLNFDNAPSGRQFEVVEEYALKGATARGARLLLSWLSKGSSSYNQEVRRVFLVAHDEQATLAQAALELEEANKRAIGYLKERDEARASITSLSKSIGENQVEITRLRAVIAQRDEDLAAANTTLVTSAPKGAAE